MTTPLVSILMAVNRLDTFLDASIKSMLEQTLDNFEFIIVANNCEDGLWVYLHTFTDPRIRLFRISLGGLSNALNFGICQARAKNIARMDADDISLSNRLQVQYDFMLDHPSIVLVGCDSLLIDEQGKALDQKFKFYENNMAIRNMLSIRNTILHPAIMVKTSLMMQMGGYKYGHMSEDHELFIRIARNKNNHFHNIKQVLFCYRRHSGQITDISYARKNFCEISGFLFTEFLLTLNFKYIIGMLVVSPLGRHALSFGRKLKPLLMKS